jgi:hypothetical protein
MPDDFGREPSKITHRTRVALPLAAVVTVSGFMIWVGTVLTDAKWRINNVERQQDGLEKKIEALPTKADLLQVRIELQEVRREAAEDREPRRRRP